jgi:hypothetical protein
MTPWAAHRTGDAGNLAWLQAAARTSAAERERCAAIVERWNTAPTHDWPPAIGTALKAGYRWLDVYCGGCRQVKPVDLASVDIHPQAYLTSLILMLRCRQCGGDRGANSNSSALHSVSLGALLESCEVIAQPLSLIRRHDAL